MKAQDLRWPFTWEQRRPLFKEGVLFVPEHYDQHKEMGFFPSWENEAPIHIEYCSGNGDWIVDKAAQHPECNWIAVERKFERVAKIWARGRRRGITNLLVVCGEALTFTRYYLPSGSISAGYINFPDPWPKTKHAKNRLIQEPFVREVARVFCHTAPLTLVTDDPVYTEQMARVMLQESLWSPAFPEPYYIGQWPSYGGSYFDTLWRSKGLPIHYLQFTKL